MTTVWVCIAATALASFTIKAAGPAVLGARPLPERASAVVALLAPSLLVALVVGHLLGPGWSALDLTVVVGVTAAVAARLCHAPTLVAVGVGVLATALLRALT